MSQGNFISWKYQFDGVFCIVRLENTIHNVFCQVTKGISAINQLIHDSMLFYDYLCFSLLSYYFTNKYSIWVDNICKVAIKIYYEAMSSE
jgi:hypothetical protein